MPFPQKRMSFGMQRSTVTALMIDPKSIDEKGLTVQAVTGFMAKQFVELIDIEIPRQAAQDTWLRYQEGSHLKGFSDFHQ